MASKLLHSFFLFKISEKLHNLLAVHVVSEMVVLLGGYSLFQKMSKHVLQHLGRMLSQNQPALTSDRLIKRKCLVPT